MDANIGIVGAGNMGGAFFNGLLKHNPHEIIHICDKSEEKLKKTITNNCCTDINELIDKVEVLIIAVKPQTFDSLMKEIKKPIEDKLIISIMAGINLETLIKKTGSARVVRAMPNLAVKFQKGVTGWIKSDAVEKEDEMIVKHILDSVGIQIEVKEEEMIDKITALSGSGPAYFFYLAELLHKKALEFGFENGDARRIAEKTFSGAAAIFNKDNQSAEELKDAVTSPGGTTEAALEHMMENGFEQVFFDALEAAKKRSEELNS